MLFNSIDFAIFLPIVFILYWFVTNKNLKVQNTFLVLASYVFYGWWNWKFLALIIFSSAIDYLVGLRLDKTKKTTNRKILLLVSVIVNLGFLGFFKYFDFFAESFASAFTFFGKTFEPTRLSLILPVGISFYTFQTLSYSIDVYNRKLEPTKDIVSFFAFVSFFPQLVAGPIERATNLLPQFYTNRIFDYKNAFDGIKQILWGLFKKAVIADNCALIVTQVFDNYTDYSGSTLLLGAFFFAFQIYGDFSGYSDIAIGTARLFGFELKQNFAYPYFSRDIAEFWRRWHISLNTWFRDYLYIPLGGSRGGSRMKIRNTFVIFLVSGLWHGANWTFVVWGIFNALLFLPLFLTKRNRKNLDVVAIQSMFPNFKEVISMASTFVITSLGWIFFRAESLPVAFSYLKNIFTRSLFSKPYVFGIGETQALLIILFITVLIIVEWFGRKKLHALHFDQKQNVFIQWSVCFIIAIVIFLFGGKQQDFIYFQF